MINNFMSIAHLLIISQLFYENSKFIQNIQSVAYLSNLRNLKIQKIKSKS